MTKARKHLRIEPFIKKLGLRIRAIRQKKEISLEKLAEACDIEYVQLSRIERGLINTSVSHIYVIAKELDITCSELFDFK